MLDTLIGGVGVVAKRGSGTLHLVGGDRRADARATNDDAAFTLTIGHSMGYGERKIGVIVVRIELSSPQVFYLIPTCLELLNKLLFQRETRVISADQDLH